MFPEEKILRWSVTEKLSNSPYQDTGVWWLPLEIRLLLFYLRIYLCMVKSVVISDGCKKIKKLGIFHRNQERLFVLWKFVKSVLYGSGNEDPVFCICQTSYLKIMLTKIMEHKMVSIVLLQKNLFTNVTWSKKITNFMRSENDRTAWYFGVFHFLFNFLLNS